MKHPSRHVRQLLDQAQRRFVRSRPGSVLILVVALLVLMALIGTAYMTMAQFDRATSVQHSFNTEVDLVLDGVINLVKGTVTSDLFLQGKFRPGNPTYNNNPPVAVSTYNYSNGTGLDSVAAAAVKGNTGNWWIASRVPDMMGNLQVTPSANPTPTWAYITGPLTGTGTFCSPNLPSPTNFYPNRTLMLPGQTTTQVDGQFWPTFSNVGGTFMAADTDGDGIADAGFNKLLTLDGITYYGAVRIVDNCAAINASIATRPNPTTTLTPPGGPSYTAMPGDFSPVNLDLEGMLISPASELYSGLLPYRMNNQTPVTAGIGETALSRSDFSYMSDPFAGTNGLFFVQQWMQMGRRMDNPGYIVAGATATAPKYQSLPVGDSVTMARNFILMNPAMTPASSSSVLEQYLTQTVSSNTIKSSPYASSATAAWFNANFNYYQGASSAAPANQQMPMRALLVARNPVSNFVPGKFADRGISTTGVGAYAFGDMISYGSHRYVCINPNPIAPPTVLTSDGHFQDPNWAFEPWTTAPTKTNVNTATFQQLYAAYWAVMADQYVNGQWQPAFPSITPPPPPPTPPPTVASDTYGRMFRNPIRGPLGTAVLTPQQMMYVRAAIAAVNTMDLRDSDDDVTSRTITIPGAVAPVGGNLKATVYGMEKQPYITQVFARNDTKLEMDWVGIELYNPYPTAITLSTGSGSTWTLAALDRTLLGGTANPWTAISTFAAAVPPITSIPAGQRVVLISNKTPTNVTLPATWPTGVQISVVAKLTQALGKELFILRPRRANCGFTSATLSNNTYAENLSTFNDLVPVDSYDFTNLPQTAPPPVPPATTSGQEWGYIRPSVAPLKNWHFVYPGPWDATQKSASTPPMPTQAGTLSQLAVSPKTLITSTLGTAQPSIIAGAKGLTYQDVPLQINSVDFGGPLKVSQTTPSGNYFPYGEFARNGDMLQVTYIGAYKLWSGDTPSQRPWEFNTVSMDSAMATAIDVTPFTPLGTSTLASENIGRFCPIDKQDATTGNYDDIQTANPALWMYHWTTRLFDFLTVQSPQDDYTPEVDPWQAEVTSTVGGWRYFPTDKNGSLWPQPVANVTSTITNALRASNQSFNTNNATEETAPVNGLVNINTANWRVLAAVPWTPASVAGYQATNAKIALAIVYYRDVNDGSGTHGHGPFKSIYELSDVPYPSIPGPIAPATPVLRNWLGGTGGPPAIQSPQYGYLSPLVPPPDLTLPSNTYVPTGDFEQQFQTMARISNLVTTRSDSYTAYILVQGWRNAETANAHLVVQRRAAIIIDRSAVTISNPNPTVINVPMD